MNPHRTPRAAIAALLFCALSFAAPNAPAAGDRPIKIVLAWVSPDAKAGATCHTRIGATLRDADTDIRTTSRSAIASRLGINTRDFHGAWLALPDATFQDNLRELRGIRIEAEDAVIMVACKPDDGHLEAVVLAQGKTVTRLRLHDVELDKKLLIATAQRLLGAARIDFQP